MSAVTASPTLSTREPIQALLHTALASAPERAVHTDSAWIHVAAQAGRTLPDQGWKLHISATPHSALVVLDRVAPLLIAAGVEFKVARSLQQLGWLNQGIMALRSQMGKFITLYPINDAEAVELAQALDAATCDLEGPAIPSDRPLRPGSLVHYRYGGFRNRVIVSPVGVMTPALRAPDGQLVPDKRQPWFTTPAWVQDPFAAAGVAVNTPPLPGPIGTRYRVRKALQQNGKGGVYVAEDTSVSPPRTVVLKEARRLIATDDSGRDARDRLAHEYALLSALQPCAYLPQVYDSFEQEGNRYVALELLPGQSLRTRWVLQSLQGGQTPLATLLDMARQLVDLLDYFHQRGYVLRDFNPNNVLVLPDGQLKLIDLELCYAVAGTQAAFGGWTRGYSRPAARASGHTPVYIDDYFSLGATLFYLATGADPLVPEDARPEHERICALLQHLRPDLPPPLFTAITQLLAVDEQSQLTLDAVRRLLHVPAAAQPAATAAQLDQARCHSLAVAIGEWLLETEQPEHPQHQWPPSEGGRTSLPISVQYGSAGVGLFLLDLYSVTKNVAFLEAARRAAQWCERWIAANADLAKTPGLYFGHGGVAWLYARLAQLTHAAADVAAAQRYARALDAIDCPHADIAHGAAGVGMVHLLVALVTDDAYHWQRSRQIADQLAHMAVPLHSGVAWPLQMGPQPELFYGYSHGCAGIGYFLLELGRFTGEQRYLDLAHAAAQTLLDAHVEVVDGAGWSWPHSPRNSVIWPHFCNGASGVGTFLARLYAQTGAPAYAAAAEKAAVAAFHGCRTTQSGVCHGIAGEGDFLLDLYQISADPQHLSQAANLAQLLLHRSRLVGERLLWETDGTPLTTADLMVGNAGVGAFLLRLAHPDTLARPLFFAPARRQSTQKEAI